MSDLQSLCLLVFLINEDSSVLELSTQFQLEVDRFTVLKVRERTVVEKVPTSTVVEISSV